MIPVFLDTNICLDILLNREPFAIQAEQVFELAAAKQIDLYASSLSFTTIFYVLKKINGNKSALSDLKSFRQSVNVLPVDTTEIDLALNSAFTDFEDAVQFFNAKENSMEYLITRNEKHFPRPTTLMQIENPARFLKRFSR